MLTETETLKLMNLAYMESCYDWSHQEIECVLPNHGGEGQGEHHVARLGSQNLGGEFVEWWASWLDGHQAYLFTAPICCGVHPTTEYSCGQIKGHDHPHVWLEVEQAER